MKKYFSIFLLLLFCNSAAFAQNETASQSSDDQPQQVHIDAKVVQITLDEEHRMGVDWAAIVSNYQSLDFKEVDAYFKGNVTKLLSTKLNLSCQIIPFNNFMGG